MKKTGLAALIFLGASLLAASVIRFFQYVSIIDFNTGFYLKGAETPGMLIYIVFGVFGAVFIALAAIGKRSGADAYSLSSDGMGDKATIPLGILYLIGAVIGLLGVFGGSELFGTVVSAASCIAFGASGLLLLNNKIPPKYVGYIQLLAAAAWFFKTAAFFGEDLIIINHSENLIDLLGYISATLYITASARFFSRIETKHSRLREIIAAGLTLLFSGTSVISKGAAILFGGSAVNGIGGVNIDMATAFAISLGFLITVFTAKKEKEIEYIVQKD